MPLISNQKNEGYFSGENGGKSVFKAVEKKSKAPYIAVKSDGWHYILCAGY
jgi:hypothetical protein